MNEGRNGSGVGWLVKVRATGCTLFIVHCTLLKRCVPLKQGSFSIQNYELRIKNERRNGGGVGWLVEFRATGCTLFIVHCTLLKRCVPLKQGSFSIQNYELRIKNERRNGGGVGWLVKVRATGCTLFIVHCKLIFRSRSSPSGLKGLVAMREPVRFFAGRQVCGENDSRCSPQWGKMYFCENFEMIVKRDGNQGIVFFDSVLCKSKYLRIRLSQYIPLKQGLRRMLFNTSVSCSWSQYIPLKQGLRRHWLRMTPDCFSHSIFH